MNRTATVERATKETSVKLRLVPDQALPPKLNSGLPFFDHLLHAMSFHGGFGLELEATGDIEVDPHHLVEDVGLVLGQAFAEILDQGAVARYGHSCIPMDDALSEAVLDVCRRPYLVYEAAWPQERCGSFDLCLLREFFQAFANRAQVNLHLHARYGHNSHHMAEALFKAFGRALSQGYRPLGQAGTAAMSTKGTL